MHCDLNIYKPAAGRREIVYWKLKAIDHDAFAKDLEASDLIQKPETDTDIDKMALQYEGTLSTMLDKHAPVKRCTITA